MSPHQKRVSIYETKEQYFQLKKEWSKTKNHSALDHSIYNIMRGHKADRGFASADKWSKHYSMFGGAFQTMIKWRLKGITMQVCEDMISHHTKDLFNDTINLALLRKAYVLSTIQEGQND